MKEEALTLINKLKAGIFRTMSANVINKVINMVSSMVLTRILTQNEYGVWSYSLNLYSYLLLITGFGLLAGALQFGTENRGRGKAYSYYRYCTENGLVINILIILVAGIVLRFLRLPIDNAKPFVIAIMPILLLEFIVTMGQSILRSQNRINHYANALNVHSVVIALGTCGGAFFGVAGVLVGRYLANFISILYEISLLRSDIPEIKHASAISKDEKKQLWHYSLFTGASSAMNCLVYSLDITLIAAMIKNATDAGIYRVGTLIPNALQFIPSSIVISILPTIIYHRKDVAWIKRNIKNTYIGLILINVLVCTLIIVLSPLIITIISGARYLPSAAVLRVLTMGYFFSGTFRTLSVNLLAAFRRVRFGLLISIVSCITDIGFNYMLIQKYGIIGAAYATLLVDIVTAALSFIYVYSLLKKGTLNETAI